MNLSKACVCAALSLTLVACGSGLSKKEAKEAWNATNNSMDSARTLGSQALSDGSAQFAWGCPQGGTLGFSGEGSETPNSVEFSLTFDFDSCKSNGIEQDGSLTWAAQMTGDDDSGTIKWSYKGSMAYGGDVEGECEIDMAWSFSYGTGGLFGISYTYSGTICGYDAADVF